MKTYEELKNLEIEELNDYLGSITKDEQEQLLENILLELGENDHYTYNLYQCSGVYFVITEEGSIIEMPDDASCSPRGGWFPTIFTGVSSEEYKAIEEIINQLDEEIKIEDLLHSVVMEVDYDFHDDEVIKAFEKLNDEETVSRYKKLSEAVKNFGEYFKSVSEFAEKYKRRYLDDWRLYYEWEGEYIDLKDNVYDCGEERGSFEGDSAEDWIRTLLNLDNLIVTAD